MEMTFPDGRSWVVTLVRDGEEFGVSNMFDVYGSETFDVPTVVEVYADGDTLDLVEGDELRFTLVTT